MVLILSLLLAAASAVELNEPWECGSDSFQQSKDWAQGLLENCNHAVKSFTNLCCKDHDYCYDMHRKSAKNRTHCDLKFCYCLDDIAARTGDFGCADTLRIGCGLASELGAVPYVLANPRDHSGKFAGFEDLRPLGLEMKTLVDSCRHSKVIAVHCHNSAYRCQEREHIERRKRMELANGKLLEHSYEDCHSTLHDCLQMLVDSGANGTCIAAANDIKSKIISNYTALDENKHGRSIMVAYPVVAARLLKRCPRVTGPLETCYRTFHDCALNNHQATPGLFNAVRKIKIVCHTDLKDCIRSETNDEYYNEACMEARKLATSLIRSIPVATEKSLIDSIGEYGRNKMVAKLDELKKNAEEVVKPTFKIFGDAVDAGVKKAKEFINSINPFG